MIDFPRFAPQPQAATRYLFFTGKGGVGKTSLSCATAAQLARAGRRVLLVSTDPASNLDEVLGMKLTGTPAAVTSQQGLDAMNINPMAAAAAYRERLIGPLRGVLPDSALRSMEEQLSGSCTVEIAAFDEFSGLIGDPAAAADYDHIVFDTAPTGHTLRLMNLAKAWDQFLAGSTNGASCLGPLAGLEKQREIYRRTVATLADPALTTLVLVSRPQASALREAERTSRELRELGVANQQLVLNGLFTATDHHDRIASAMEARGALAITAAAPFLASLPVFTVKLQPHNLLGMAALTALLDPSAAAPADHRHAEPEPPDWQPPPMESLASLIDSLAAAEHGVILTMGKGGVGKTTVAAAIAVNLARSGHRVHLSTTDPAAHLAQTVAGEIPGLTVSRIDPAAETAAYSAEVLATTGAALDEAGRALLEEDLRSPCTEEIAVFRAFAREVGRGKDGFVVLDTAPTGHTLLLLDASQSHLRELERQGRRSSTDDVQSLLARLRDPAFTSVLLVTLPEATPVHEAAALQNDLRRAGIEPRAWVINQSLLLSGTTDPILLARERSEHRYLDEVALQLAPRTAWLPWMVTEPTGPDALAALTLSAPPSGQSC
jgi:arsenite-transporting ATPase